ncbi:MAG: hypothetical protein C0518_05040 [Opitutus sp.]|nr:hypothetical protein [Opitutus sp.]
MNNCHFAIRSRGGLWFALFLAVTLLRGATYLDDGFIATFAEVPPPPTDDSPAGLADLQTVLHVQADRTSAQVSRAQRVAPHTPFLMGEAVFGAWFQAKNIPRTAAIMKTVWDESNQVSGRLKKQWSRARPPQRDPRVQPCVAVPADSSYPSGHASNAAVWAAIFSAAFPEKADAFAAQAQETAWARVLGGAHFPSDTQAGRMLGEAIARRMLASPAMREALKEMQAEVAALQARQGGS